MLSRKQKWKRLDGRCLFCGEKDLNLCDTHRLTPGSEGGKYRSHNVVTACAMCHRKIHSGRIEVKGKFFSSKGWIIIFYEDGEERIEVL